MNALDRLKKLSYAVKLVRNMMIIESIRSMLSRIAREVDEIIELFEKEKES